MTTETLIPPPSAAELCERFDAAPAYTVGIEDEVMVLDPVTFELAARANAVLERTSGDARFKLELPASQLEILTPPAATVPEAVRALLDGRRDLVQRAGDVARFAAAGFHPSSPTSGVPAVAGWLASQFVEPWGG